MNNFFRFKQFTVHQENCAMKVGTDGVLLGAWADCRGATHILDIGTGTGLIALMLAQRSGAQIDAVEIDPMAAQQAASNVQVSPFAERIKVYNVALQSFTTNKVYDLIVSNPPYFRHALKSPQKERNMARHDDSLPFADLLAGVKRLLSREGCFALILPPQEGEDFLQIAEREHLYCHEKTTVIPRPRAIVKRCLFNFGYEQKTCRESELLIETDTRHIYSAQFTALTKDFYLKM